MEINHEENERFLRDKLFNSLTNDIKIEWSNKSPYYAEINGSTLIFNNSYEAHIEKHPKNIQEEKIWKTQLLDFPNKIEDSYYEYSQKLINTPSSLDTWFYDEENYSLNKDFIVIIDNNKTSTIRVSLKRSHKDYNKIVISTCHPRTKKKYFFNRNNKQKTNYFYNKKIDITNKNNVLAYLFFPNETEYKEHENNIFKILYNYYEIAKNEIKILEEYNKEKIVQYTDLYDIEKIKEHIDNIFLYDRYIYNTYIKYLEFYSKETTNLITKTNINNTKKSLDGISETIERLLTLDQNNTIKDYIKNKYNKDFATYNDVIINEEIEDEDENVPPYSTKKKYYAKKLKEIEAKWKEETKKETLIYKYRHAIENNGKTKVHAISPSNYTNSKKHENKTMLSPQQLFIIGTLNGFSYKDCETLLKQSITCFPPSEYIKEKTGYNLEEDWEKLYETSSIEINNDRYKIYKAIENYKKSTKQQIKDEKELNEDI